MHVCYIDRAGNESRAEFLIRVKEKNKKEQNTENTYESQIKNNEVKTDENENSEIKTKNPDKIVSVTDKVVDGVSGFIGTLFRKNRKNDEEE